VRIAPSLHKIKRGKVLVNARRPSSQVSACEPSHRLGGKAAAEALALLRFDAHRNGYGHANYHLAIQVVFFQLNVRAHGNHFLRAIGKG